MVRCLELLEDHNTIKLSVFDIVREFVEKRPEHKSLTVSQAFESYIDELQKSGKSDKQAVNHKGHFCKIYGHLKTTDLTRECIEDFLNLLKIQDYADKTRNHHLSTIKSVCRREISYKRLLEDPTVNIKRLKIINEIAVLSWKDVHRFLHKLYELGEFEACLFFSIQAFAGLRRAEVYRLIWSDFKDDEIRVVKNSVEKSKGRGVPVLVGLASVLSVIPSWGSGNTLMFTLSEKSLDRRLDKALKLCSIKKTGRNMLRHTFVSHRLAQTKNAESTAHEADHTVRTQQQSYAALVTQIDGNNYFNFIL